MTNFKNIVLNAIKEAEKLGFKNMLHKDFAPWILCLPLIFCSINPTNAKTNYNALHNNHEIIAKYEDGGKGYQAISKDNYGGYSYGKWQLSTNRKNNKPSTFDFFLKYAKENTPFIYNALEKAGGQPAAYSGNKFFIKTWKVLANTKEFQQTYDDFILHTQIIPVYKRLDENKNLDTVTTWGSENNAIQAAIKSTIIQHGSGGAYGIIRNIMEINKPKTKEAFLNDLYKYRANRFPKYKNRYISEHKELKKYLASKESIISNVQKLYGFYLPNLNNIFLIA